MSKAKDLPNIKNYKAVRKEAQELANTYNIEVHIAKCHDKGSKRHYYSILPAKYTLSRTPRNLRYFIISPEHPR